MRDCVVLASIASRKSIAVAKSIKELLNIRVIGVAHTDHPHIFSKYFDRAYIVRVDRSDIGWVYTVLGVAKEYRCRAVLPIDFIDFYMFSKHRQFFDELGITLVSPPHESIVVASDRVKCQEALRGIAYFPPQVFVERREDIDSVYSLRPPIVVKNLGDASNPTFHLDYETAIKNALSRAPVLVQEYIEGVPRGYYALAFNGNPLLEFTHQRIVEYTPIGGASLGARGIVKDPRLFELGRKIIEKLRWSGVIMVETRYFDEAGIYYVIELNPKFWGSIDLPESHGYKFSALLVVLYLYGYDYALELKKKLAVRNGSFVWILDALRYIPKIPDVWLRLAKIVISNHTQSDVELTDVPRNVVQVVKALHRFKREKNVWSQYLEKSREQSRAWINRYLRFLSSPRKIAVLDFDATLVKLPVDWVKVRRALVEVGLLYPWESINRAFSRCWSTDTDLYQRLSEAVEQYEFKAIDSVELLAKSTLLEKLSRYARLCIATKQTVDVVTSILKKLGLKDFVDFVVGRDSGFGPMKKSLYSRCAELYKGSEALVIDDGIEYLVEAYRLGYTPMHAASNSYSIAKSYRLGIPSGEINELLSLIISTMRRNAVPGH